jgi:uncharacterized iron-regulated membrane protein
VNGELTVWQRWVRQPQKMWIRRALFQAHLWSGIATGLYLLMMSVTGSVLVYRNELYRAATPEPTVSTSTAPRLNDAQLSEAARRAYPGYEVAKINRTVDPDRAVDIWLRRGGRTQKRLFDPRSGNDVGPAIPPGIWMVSELMDLHDNLLAGQTGRKLNGLGGLVVLVLAGTGLVIWWPGSKTWRRSLKWPAPGLGVRRWNWHWHSMIGFWSLGFTVIFGLSGIYLSFPEQFQDLVDKLDPPATPTTARIMDKVIYWLAFLHFGRVNGIGIPCSGPGICDQTTKAVWALAGLAPAAMFVTGGIMWWTRVLRPWLRRAGSRDAVVS